MTNPGLLSIAQGIKRIENPVVEEMQRCVFEALEETDGYAELSQDEKFRIRVAVLYTLHVVGNGPWELIPCADYAQQQRLLDETQQALARAVAALAKLHLEKR